MPDRVELSHLSTVLILPSEPVRSAGGPQDGLSDNLPEISTLTTWNLSSQCRTFKLFLLYPTIVKVNLNEFIFDFLGNTS